MKVKVDQELCTGDAICVDLCPEVFELDGDKAKVLVNPVPEDLRDACQDAADSCPESCIYITEDDEE
jgi:ferredoxin